MMILNLFLSLLARPQKKVSFLVIRALGCFFLLFAIGIGLYFLFQALVPVFGYLESGAMLAGFLAVIGVSLLFLSKRKEPRPLDDIMEETQDIFKQVNDMMHKVDVNDWLKNNAGKILLGSFVAGLVLSQFKDTKKLLEFKDRLLQLKNSSHLKDWLQ